MTEYLINAGTIEDLQITHDLIELNKILVRAHSTVIQGGTVVHVRQDAEGTIYRFDEITTEAEVKTYQETVFKYL